jgi:glycosyltransferase involved in cell wall biosynthesis
LKWSIITGEYPPERGGLADYSRLVARGLAEAGDDVEVYAPASRDPRIPEPPVIVRNLDDRFGPRALLELNRLLKPRRDGEVLVQYVPQAFGMKGLNLAFALWLYSMRDARISLMFHEVAYPVIRGQPLRHRALAATNRLMALLAARSARRILVSTTAWFDLVRSLARAGTRIEWCPVPSNVAVAAGAGAPEVRKTFAPNGRRLIGHFGTYGPLIVGPLADCIRALAAGKDDRSILLMGRGARRFRDCLLAGSPELSGKVHATGGLSDRDLSRHVATCDLMIQPYPDGVSSRRTSIMLALSHGVPAVTNSGEATEACWKDGAVALCASTRSIAQTAERVLSDEGELRRLRADSRRFYAERFDIRHTIEALRQP